MNILVGMECSGRIREAFRRRGHNAWSCDKKPDENNSPYHFQDDLRNVVRSGTVAWDIGIFHPDCTFLCVSGIHWNTRRPERAELTDQAIAFTEWLWDLDMPNIVIENPVGVLSTRSKLGHPTQIIQPYQFGDDASKKTCLWIRGNIKPLVPTMNVLPRFVNGKPRWGNQTDSGQNKLGPSPTRSADRARTYPGIAEAMAAQWGGME